MFVFTSGNTTVPQLLNILSVFFTWGQANEVRRPDHDLNEGGSSRDIDTSPKRSGRVTPGPQERIAINRVKLRGSDARYTQPTILDSMLRLRRGVEGSRTGQDTKEPGLMSEAIAILGEQGGCDSGGDTESEDGNSHRQAKLARTRMAPTGNRLTSAPAASFEQQILDSSPPSTDPAELTRPRDTVQ